jgi:serine/threonine-protein kinase
VSDTDDELGEETLVQALIEVLGTRYRFVSRLGAGAFGDVYCVHDTMLERNIAVKRVRLDAFADAAQRKELRERTVREAIVAAKLKHPHIVTIHDIVDRPDMCFILMEFIEGVTLARLLKDRGRLSLEETARLLGQTGAALDFAHQKGVVHRDIKPANIMIEAGSGNVKVMDFGIAKSDASELTAAGSVLGTPNYMSPEQARGDLAIGPPADLFSLGCVLYECLVGEKAFVGTNVMATLMTIINDGPRPFDRESLGLPPAFDAVLQRALAKDPAGRFASGSELIDALTSLPPEVPVDQSTVVIPGPEAPPAAALVVTRREPGERSSFDARLQGSLADTTVAELIREVYSARSTGILHVERDGAAKRLYFKKGNVVFANSDVNDDRLGEFLIRTGEIDRAAFDRASERMRRTGKRMGASLIDLEVLVPEKLTALVRGQVQQIIYSVFDWNRGAYGFEILDRPVEEDIIVDLSTAELILIGVRAMGSIEHIRSALGSLDRVLRHTENPLLLYQKMTLTPSEGYVLSRIDGSTSVAEIASISPLGKTRRSAAYTPWFPLESSSSPPRRFLPRRAFPPRRRARSAFRSPKRRRKRRRSRRRRRVWRRKFWPTSRRSTRLWRLRTTTRSSRSAPAPRMTRSRRATMRWRRSTTPTAITSHTSGTSRDCWRSSSRRSPWRIRNCRIPPPGAGTTAPGSRKRVWSRIRARRGPYPTPPRPRSSPIATTSRATPTSSAWSTSTRSSASGNACG